jgi:hypothetical protein
VEPELSLSCSQQPTTLSCSDLHQSSPYHPILFVENHFNIIFPFTLLSAEWSLSFRSPLKNLVWNSLHTHTCHISYPSHPPWSYYTNNMCWAEQIMTLFIMLFPHLTSSLLGPNIFLCALFSTTFSLCSPLHVTDQVTTLIQDAKWFSWQVFPHTAKERLLHERKRFLKQPIAINMSRKAKVTLDHRSPSAAHRLVLCGPRPHF